MRQFSCRNIKNKRNSSVKGCSHGPIATAIYYRPQTKFAKVVFLHPSVSHSVHRGEYLGRYPLPGQVHPPGRYIPRAGTSPGQVPPWQVHLPVTVHAGIRSTNGLFAGMHSCLLHFIRSRIGLEFSGFVEISLRKHFH